MRYIVLITFCICTICNANQQHTSKHGGHKSYLPDTTINKKLVLRNWQSIEREFGDIMSLVKDSDDGPFVYFKNKTGTEYLKMYFFPGNIVNEFSFFEIGKMSDKVKPLVHESKFKSFYTESGIGLGITKAQLIAIKGDFFRDSTKNGFTILKYEIDNSGNSKYLKRHKEFAYLAEFFFDHHGRLARIRFGFEYP